MSLAFRPLDDARSALMKRVRQKGTAPEERVAAVLREIGVRYRRNVKRLPGSPDFANVSQGWALFVHGCFWHGHEGCPLAKLPKHNRSEWRAKLAANRDRDERKSVALREHGLRVRTLWQCELADAARARRTVARHVKSRTAS